MTVLRMTLLATALLLVGACDTVGFSYRGSSLGGSYYYGSSWYDPYYSRRGGYYPSRPPSYRPPLGGGRPANLPSRAPSRPMPSLRR